MGLTKQEFGVIAIIIAAVILATYVNLIGAARRARDNQRKNDIRSVSDALNEFVNDFAFFPSAQNGNIMACGDPNRAHEDDFAFVACKWGTDAIRDLSDPSYPAYIERLPLDPKNNEGANYYYVSDGHAYQLFASLEDSRENEYDPKIAARRLPCGSKICNFGLASGKTPLNKSLEEIEKSK